jgi:putative glutamine amidotransferase
MKNLTLGYCEGNDHTIAPFDRVFDHKQDVSHSLKGVDAVVFWGGTDIHPSFYKEGHHHLSGASSHVSERDLFEWKVMLYCKVNNIPMIGVCRGAQFLCAFAGGKLVQHCSGHNNTSGHQMITHDGRYIFTTSAHHQMMYPWDVPHELLARTEYHRSNFYEGAVGEDNLPTTLDMLCKDEPEVVYFPEIRALAIQGHPEWAVDTKFADYCNNLIVEKLLQDVVETC